MEFSITTFFKASAKELYTAWLNSEKHSEMTGGQAVGSTEEDGQFSAWDGYIWGKNIKLKPFKYIKQSWRTKRFADAEEDSILEIFFEESAGNTKITLVHSNLPEHCEQYRKGWQDHYFNPMNNYFA